MKPEHANKLHEIAAILSDTGRQLYHADRVRMARQIREVVQQEHDPEFNPDHHPESTHPGPRDTRIPAPRQPDTRIPFGGRVCQTCGGRRFLPGLGSPCPQCQRKAAG